MFDFIKLHTKIDNWDIWRDKTPHLQLNQSIDIDTGEVIRGCYSDFKREQFTTEYFGKLNNYKFTIKESEKKWIGTNAQTKEYFLTIQGSVHKNYDNGSNYSMFGWTALQFELNNIVSTFCISAVESKITRIEVGVNIELPFSPYLFLRESLLSYKGGEFSRYKPDRKGVVIGYEYGLTEYTVKAYDKGLQYKLPNNLFRFELSYKKMTPLKKTGVKTIADLQNKDLVSSLSNLLLTSWDNIMLCDLHLDLNELNLSVKDSHLLKDGCNPKYWENLKLTNKAKFNYLRRKYKRLISIYGDNRHTMIKELISRKWQELLVD